MTIKRLIISALNRVKLYNKAQRFVLRIIQNKPAYKQEADKFYGHTN
jgi:hypothetical protein